MQTLKNNLFYSMPNNVLESPYQGLSIKTNRHKLLTITDKNIDSVISENKLALIYFKAYWNQACFYTDDIFDKLNKTKLPQMVIGMIDVGNFPNIVSSKYPTPDIPCFILFKHGKEARIINGLTTLDHLLEAIKEINV